MKQEEPKINLPKMTMAEAGRLGGMARHPNKGFGSNPERARLAALKSAEAKRRKRESDQSRP